MPKCRKANVSEAEVLVEGVRTLRCNDAWVVTNRSKFSSEGTDSCRYTIAVGQVGVCENADSHHCRILNFGPPPLMIVALNLSCSSVDCRWFARRSVQATLCKGTVGPTGELVLNHKSGRTSTAGAAGRRCEYRCLQPASPAPGAGASPGSTVLPEMVRRAPVAWVISTLRGWLRGDAGMVTCSTPSV